MICSLWHEAFNWCEQWVLPSREGWQDNHSCKRQPASLVQRNTNLINTWHDMHKITALFITRQLKRHYGGKTWKFTCTFFAHLLASISWALALHTDYRACCSARYTFGKAMLASLRERRLAGTCTRTRGAGWASREALCEHANSGYFWVRDRG